jgi:pimeloyl-ACP methyl ester carboxylesterase
MDMPCLLYVGQDDPRLGNVQKCAESLSDVTFFSLPGCNHVGAFTSADRVLPRVKAFLADANAT